MILGLAHIAVRVTDMDKSLDFYRNVLGLPEQFRLTHDNGDPWLVYLRVADRQFIELFPGADAPYSIRTCAGLVHICIEVDDIQATYRELTGRGLVARGEPILGADGAWQFWTADPDENQIEFHQYTPEARQIRSAATS